MSHERIRVGVIGCGAISGRYFQTSASFPILEMAACADLNRAAAEKKAAEFGVPRVLGVDELLADESIDIVLNLTVPKAHAPICMAALEAGKHVACEKPLAVTRDDGLEILQRGEEADEVADGVRRTRFWDGDCRRLGRRLTRGRIGKPVAFTAFMLCPGHEHWHPSPGVLLRSRRGADAGYGAVLCDVLC